MTSVPAITCLHDSKYSLHQRMANAVIDVSLRKGDCLPQDLLSMGFTFQHIVALYHMANEMAEVELRLLKASKLYAAAR